MNDEMKNLKGSPSRDLFKQKHKSLASQLYACDIDFVLVDKMPVPDIVAALDYKQRSDDITFSEVIAYNALLQRGIPVFIVQGDAEQGSFVIYRYQGGNHRNPRYDLTKEAQTFGWEDFQDWEFRLRERRRKRYGHAFE